MLCVFDCETVPDVELLRNVYDEYKNESDDLKLCNAVFDAQEERSGSSFLPIPFHRIITISALICDDFGRFVKIGNFASNDSSDFLPDESEILGEFLKYLNKNNPKLVSFNGRNFDLPTIMLRAMKYNLNAESYFETSNEMSNKSKWENYRSRYSENFHIDLLESLGSFGAAKGLKLDIVCKMAGIVGKYNTKGDDVYKLFYEKKHSEIAEYCQSDVLNTYWLYLKYQLLQGKISIMEYGDLLNVFLDKLPKDRSYSEVFAEAIKVELGIKTLKNAKSSKI